MKKIIGLSLAILIVLCLTSMGTWAYLQDNETSSTNKITAGTLALTTNNTYGVTQTFNSPALKPNVSTGSQTISLKNVGTINGQHLDISFGYVKSDGTPNTVNMTADNVSGILQVVTLDYNRAIPNLLTLVSDSNGNGYKDVYDLAHANLTLAGLSPSASKNFVIELKMRDGISNDFQADGVNITMTFVLRQN